MQPYLCRIIITITLTGQGVPTSIQLADKNKTGCYSIQSLLNYWIKSWCVCVYIYIYIYILTCSCIDQQWTCPHVNDGMLHCAINNSPSSELILKLTQLVTQMNSDFDNSSKLNNLWIVNLAWKGSPTSDRKECVKANNKKSNSRF